ncbi:Gar1 small nucleolar RNP [Spraguea lophii 42_110]|uniref:H/ACA ribonucleoprotein complex subunit n=1 Tax=Spraguea lophii (strain 42_110) TaxID=1358809 RepID=S7W5H5_SPRLO|nr:Gar1 small nucleolar RNP [Spraguea lophii 42_110]
MKYQRRQQPQQPPVPMGSFLYYCENNPVVKLTCNDIPFPNQNVFLKNKKIGKIDEVLGKLDEVYVTVTLDENIKNNLNDLKIKKDDVFYVTPKFLKKEFLLPREQTLDKKEKNEKEKKHENKNRRDDRSKNKRDDKKSFNQKDRLEYNFKKTLKHKNDKRSGGFNKK